MKSRFLNARVLAILIFVFVAFTQFECGASRARDFEALRYSVDFQTACLYFLVAYWLYLDGQEKWMWRVWDIGYFLWIAWPAVLAYYLIKTRGIKRASLIFLLLATTLLVSFGIGAALRRAKY